MNDRNTWKEKAIFRYQDKELGRELVLTEGGVEYTRKHGMTLENIKSTL